MKRLYRLFAAACLLFTAGVLLWTPAFFADRAGEKNAAESVDAGADQEGRPTGGAYGDFSEEPREKEHGKRLIQVTEPDEEFLSILELDLAKQPEGFPADGTQQKERLSRSIAQIVSGNYLGSGVIVEISEEEIVLASVKHLLMYGTTAQVTFRLADGEERTVLGNVIGLSAQYDLGYLSVPVSELGYEFAGRLRYCEMDETAFGELRQGDTVVQVGSTDGPAADLYCGYVENKWIFVSEFNSFMIMNQCAAMQGMSGGGAFDAKGRLVGIITGGDGEATVCMPVNLVLEEYGKLTEQ